MSPKKNWEDKKDLITSSLESGIDTILDLDDLENIQKIGNLNIVTDDENGDIYLVGINGQGDGTLPLSDNLKSSEDFKKATIAKNKGKTVCAYVEITDKSHEQLAVSLGKVVDYIILVGSDWKVIPLENIIADLQKDNVKIIAAVSDVSEAQLAIETLEVGSDGIIFEPKDINQIKEITSFFDILTSEEYELVDANITNIKPLASGDRVCIDTTSIMEPGEGMLIGSYSKALFFIHSESLESEYVASRPFRVNAGPVQAYVMGPNGKTRYLSELKTGDEVLIVNDKGKTRKSLVGRSKIEKRPLMLIEAEYDDIKIKTLVQNAETIRLVDSSNNPVSITSLKPGDKVKVFIDKNARHFGISIEEQIIEQ